MAGLTLLADGRHVDIAAHDTVTDPAYALAIEATVSADPSTIRRISDALDLAAETISKMARALAAKLPDDSHRGN